MNDQRNAEKRLTPPVHVCTRVEEMRKMVTIYVIMIDIDYTVTHVPCIFQRLH